MQGPLPPARARVTGFVADVRVFPLLSWTATVTAGEWWHQSTHLRAVVRRPALPEEVLK